MRRISLTLTFCLLLGACSEPPDPATPKGAFAMMAKCIDAADRRCFFRCLERDSRWSIATIHRTLVEMRGLVEKSYPAVDRASAYGAWAEEAAAATPEALFEAFCNKRQCLEKMARGFGAVTKVTTTGDDAAVVETIRGAAFKMRRADGIWGLDLFGDELQEAKLRMSDRLKQVRENAKAYDEQRLANEGAK